MLYLAAKVIISALLIAVIAELSKRSIVFGALLASIPFISVMAMLWLYIDTHNSERVARLSIDIFWLVIPSLVLFISLPIFLRYKLNFYLSLLFSCGLTSAAYGLTLFLLRRL